MCILLTPVLYCNTTVLIEVYLHCFTEFVSLRVIGKPTSRAEISSPSTLYLKSAQVAHPGSALELFVISVNKNFAFISTGEQPNECLSRSRLCYLLGQEISY